MTTKNILIYGANGYTGKLIVAEAVARGLSPVVAGRNTETINDLAKQYDLSARIFDLSNLDTISDQLKDIALVIHCAGPFSSTAEPMMQACIQSQCHYLDITGEISVFERAFQLNKAASDAGIVLCPGAGFDVIPTDCLASSLKQKMPDATFLTLGFDSASGFSPGTAKTSVEGLGKGGTIRENGELKNVALAYKLRQIDFGNGVKNAMTIPWGDISTAYRSTGIANIEVYLPASPRACKRLQRLNSIRKLLGWKPVNNWLKKRAAVASKGPNEEQRKNLNTYIWGEVKNAKGESLTGRLTTANGYQLTVLGTLAIADFVLSNETKSGFTTPSQLMGNDLITKLEGSSEIDFTS